MNNQNQQPTPQNTLYLFYSKNYCEHSKRCLDRLSKNGLLSKITLADIDNQDLMIPPFITSVPTLYNSVERRILSNEDLFNWIEENTATKSLNSELGMNEITGDANIFAYHQTEMAFGGGNSYAFIDDKQNDKLPSSFEFLDGSNQKDMVMPTFTRIDTNMTEAQTPGSANNEKTQRQNELTSAYDKLMAERNSELKNTIGHMRV
jgi:hypothetical protein